MDFLTEFQNEFKGAYLREFIVDLIIHLVVIFIFVTCLFFFFSANMVQNSIQKLISGLAMKSSLTMFDSYYNKQTPEKQLIIDYLLSKDPNNEGLNISLRTFRRNAPWSKYSANLWLVGSTLFLAFVVISLITLYIVKFNHKNRTDKIPIANILTRLLFTFLLLGGIEMSFVFTVIMKYIPVNIGDTFASLSTALIKNINS